MKSLLRTTATFATLLVLGGCTGEIHKKSMLGTYNYLSVDARQRLITESNQIDPDTLQKRHILCAEPSPNVFVVRSTAGGARANGQVNGQAASGGVAGASAEAGAGLGARTQTLELLRDAYYRACEGYANGIIDKEDYQSIIANIDSTMIALAAVDALGSATLAGNAAIAAPTSSIELTDENGKVTKASTGGGSAQSADNGSNQAAEKTAEALKAIALYSLANSRARTDRLAAVKLAKEDLTAEQAKAIVELAQLLSHQGHAIRALPTTNAGKHGG